MLVHILNHGIHVLIVLESIQVLEVTSEEDEDVVCYIMLGSLSKMLDEPGRLGVSVEVLGLEVVDPGITALSEVPTELLGRAVVAIENMGQNLCISTEAFGVWSPDELHLAVVQSLIFVSVIETGKEPSIETHFGEETSVGVRVTEWIDLPTDSWLDSELIKDPLVSHNMVIDHVFISWASLVVHRPPSIDKLKLTIGNEFLDLRLHVVFLLSPPHREELHLNF